MYRVFWAALRSNHEPSLKQLLQTGRFLHHLVHHTTTTPTPAAASPAGTEGGAPAATAPPSPGPAAPSGLSGGNGGGNGGGGGRHLALAATAHTGHALALGSALRLQCATLPPRAWLRGFLQNHATWHAFLPLLEQATVARQRGRGMGLRVPGDPPAPKKKAAATQGAAAAAKGSKAPGANYNPMMGFGGFDSDDDSDGDDDDFLLTDDDDDDHHHQASAAADAGAADAGADLDTRLIDLGSRLAKSLGFDDDAAPHAPAAGHGAAALAAAGCGSPCFDGGRAKKGKGSAKKKKKRRSKGLRESLSAPGFDVGVEEGSEEGSEQGEVKAAEADAWK
jgi:hypothetical protein